MITKTKSSKQEVMNLNSNNDAFNFIKKAVPDLKEAILNFLDSEDENTLENKSFGIYGKWGTGKSTLIYNVFKEISELRKDLIIVKVDLWKFELYPDDLQKITEEIIANIFKGTRTFKWIRKAAKLVLDVALSIPYTNIWASAAQNFVKQGRKNSEPVYDINKRLKKLEKSFKNKQILIIFDDLDRCSDNKIELYLNYIKHVIASLSNQMKTIIILDYQYVKEKLFVDHEKAINFFKKIINKNFRVEEYLDHTISRQPIDDWINPDLIKNLHLVYPTPRDRKILLDKTNQLFNYLLKQKLVKLEWTEVIHYYVFLLVCLNNDIEEYSNLKISRFIHEDIAEFDDSINAISKALNNYLGNNFEKLNAIIPTEFSRNWKRTLLVNTTNLLDKKFSFIPLNYWDIIENNLKVEISHLKFKKNSYLLVNNGNKIDILNFYFGGFKYSKTSKTVFENTNEFINFDLLAKRNSNMYNEYFEWRTPNHFENIFMVNKENKFLFNKQNDFHLLTKIQQYFTKREIKYDLLGKYGFLVKQINQLCLDLPNSYWNLEDWDNLKAILEIVIKFL